MTPEVLRAKGLKGKEAPSNIALWLSVVTLHFFFVLLLIITQTGLLRK